MLYVILLVILVMLAIAIILFCRFISKKRIDQTIDCMEGRFVIRGNKNYFTIKKENRFIFTVENGQIIAVEDKAISSKQIKYGGY